MTTQIPQTLEAARQMSGVRFHEWNEECVEMVARILNAGREVNAMGTVDPLACAISALAERLDDTRLQTAIPKIAVKLGAKVTNF